MLLGQYSSVLNEKNRVSLPKKFRSELGEHVIIAKWYEGCLAMISEGRWQGLLLKLKGDNLRITGPVRDTDRFILGSAYEMEPDAQGRIVIPKSLVEYANLKSNVTFLGLGDRVEMWNEAEWTKREEYVAKNAADFIEEIERREK